MPEHHVGTFKKLFGGFGAHKQQEEASAAEAEALSARVPDDPLDEPEETVHHEEPDTFAVPAGNALAKVWTKCGNSGLPSLNPKYQVWFAGLSVPEETLKKSFYKLLRYAAAVSQRWLDMESAAALARAAAVAEAQRRAAEDALTAQSAQDDAQSAAAALSRLSGEDAPETPDEAPAVKAEPVPELDAPLDVDEMAEVLIASDGLAAWVLLLPPSGNGKTLVLEDLRALLETAGVTHGISQDALEAVIAQKTYFRLLLVARATDPVPGKDGWVEDHFPRSNDPIVIADSESDSKTVDYRARSNVQAIKKGTVICDIHPPVPGKPGTRVDGAPIPPASVRAASAPNGIGTAVSEDGRQLLAVSEGFLEFRAGVFNVKNVLNISGDVDYSTGNIDFRGDVSIRGDVREQFSVKATGNVHISGLVEAACVEAGGDVVIANGVSGNGQAVIRGKHVRAKYLENCTVYAEELESEYILTSHVYCSGSVLVSGGRGAIIGGQVVAAQNVKASRIGTQTGRTTDICLGVRPDVREEFATNKTELSALRKEASELAKRATYLKKRMEEQGRPDTRSSREIEAAVVKLTSLAEREKTLTGRQNELNGQLTSLPTSRLECSELYPGVRLTIGSAMRNIETLHNACTAVFDKENYDIKFI